VACTLRPNEVERHGDEYWMIDDKDQDNGAAGGYPPIAFGVEYLGGVNNPVFTLGSLSPELLRKLRPLLSHISDGSRISLAQLNDQGVPFTLIADVIQEVF
jgi:hypothetical protein